MPTYHMSIHGSCGRIAKKTSYIRNVFVTKLCAEWREGVNLKISFVAEIYEHMHAHIGMFAIAYWETTTTRKNFFYNLEVVRMSLKIGFYRLVVPVNSATAATCKLVPNCEIVQQLLSLFAFLFIDSVFRCLIMVLDFPLYFRMRCMRISIALKFFKNFIFYVNQGIFKTTPYDIEPLRKCLR